MIQRTINTLSSIIDWLQSLLPVDYHAQMPVKALSEPLGSVLTVKWDDDADEHERALYEANPLAFWLRPDRHEHGVVCWAVEGVWERGEHKSKHISGQKSGRVHLHHLMPGETVFWDREESSMKTIMMASTAGRSDVTYLMPDGSIWIGREPQKPISIRFPVG